MNRWMDCEGLFDNRPVAFGTGGTHRYRKVKGDFPSQFGSKDAVGVVGPNNVILAC